MTAQEFTADIDDHSKFEEIQYLRSKGLNWVPVCYGYNKGSTSRCLGVLWCPLVSFLISTKYFRKWVRQVGLLPTKASDQTPKISLARQIKIKLFQWQLATQCQFITLVFHLMFNYPSLLHLNFLCVVCSASCSHFSVVPTSLCQKSKCAPRFTKVGDLLDRKLPEQSGTCITKLVNLHMSLDTVTKNWKCQTFETLAHISMCNTFEVLLLSLQSC